MTLYEARAFLVVLATRYAWAIAMIAQQVLDRRSRTRRVKAMTGIG
jgi:hypothetical protein